MRFVKALGHEQRKGLADQLGGRVSEHPFGRPVEEEEVSVTVGGHDAVADRFRQHTEVLLSLPELLLQAERLLDPSVLRSLGGQGQGRHGVDPQEAL